VTPLDPERLARLADVAFGSGEEAPAGDAPTAGGDVAPPAAEDVTIGRYLVLGTIGRGGFGVVHRVLDRALGRTVALKLLAGEATPDALERFRREVRLAASLQHEHVIRIHEVGAHEGRLFYTMDLVEGPTLLGLVAPPRQLARLAGQVARGLHAAHEQGIVHRDVKPENILVGPGDRAVLIDFSLARGVLDEERLTRSGVVAGTLAYLSPEQALGKRAAIDSRTDVYGLGATLYRVLTGRPPHEGQSPAEVLTSVLRRVPPPPRALRPELPEELEAIVVRALSVDPRDRQPTALALALELEAFAEGRAPRRRGTGRPAALVAGGALALASIAGLAAWRWRPPAPPPPPPPPLLSVRLVVDAPLAGAVTLADDALEVRGRAALDGGPPAALRVAVDGAPVEVTDGAFQASVAPRSGPVRVVAWCDGRPDVRQEVAVVVSAGPLARWFASVPGEGRPETPFRPGLRCSATPGVYLWDAGHGVTTELVWVAAGPFQMGSRWVASAPEFVHELPRFLVGRTEVTWAEYRAYLVAHGRTSAHDPGPAGDRFPANHLSWAEARALAAWLGGRLPSDAEWERAARGTDGRHWPWGGTSREAFLPRCNFNDLLCTLQAEEGHTPDAWDEVSDGFAGLAPVGSYPEGASPCGALDMCGNVNEWCEDWFDPEASPRSGEYPPREGAMKCTRGGNYRDVWYMTHPAQRQPMHPGSDGSQHGLRIVVDVAAP